MERKGCIGWVTYPLPTGSENLGEGRLHKTGPACVVLRYRARLAAGQPATFLWPNVTRYAEQDQDIALRRRRHRNFNIIMYLKVNDLRCMR